MPIQARRAYEPARPSDGRRYLVDRLWPRGVTKKELRLTGWLKELAPSPELRAWYGHDPARYETFRSRFRAELAGHGNSIEGLLAEAEGGMVTLVFASRTTEHCNASVLQELLEERLSSRALARRVPARVPAGRPGVDPR